MKTTKDFVETGNGGAVLDLIFFALIAAIIAFIGLWAFLCLASAIRKHGLKAAIKGLFCALTPHNNGHNNH